MNLAIKDILEKIDHTKFVGDEHNTITELKQLLVKEVGKHTLAWVSEKNVAELEKFTEGTFICPDTFSRFKPGCNYILVKQPRLAFKEVIELFWSKPLKTGISKTAVIDTTAKFGKNIFIGEHVIIEEHCVIGDNSRIGHNTVILAHTVIHENVLIGNNNTIGGTGFGYEKDTDGTYSLIPHIGNVVIEQEVEIGNNTCIDRAVLGSTRIGQNVKIDNLVHIAHGVVIGKNTLVIANSLIGGSTVVGENVWIAPSVSVLNKKNIGDNVTLGMGTVVIKDVADNEIIIGNPGKPLEKK
jgi:UDP-3-O-[3-hydroxymyristoyl] glucosamine N-acyltransferase